MASWLRVFPHIKDCLPFRPLQDRLVVISWFDWQVKVDFRSGRGYETRIQRFKEIRVQRIGDRLVHLSHHAFKFGGHVSVR